MRTILLGFVLGGMVTSALGQGRFQYVVPNQLTAVEGNSSTTAPFTSSSFRFQQVFDASQFAFVGSATCRIDQLSFRIDASAINDAVYSFVGSSIQLSTTPRGPDSLSPVFSENIGGDVLTVRSGGVAFGDHYRTGQSPQPFGATATFSTPFLYVPSRGNLLLEIFAIGGTVLFPGALDAQATFGDSVSRVFAGSESATSGTADTLGLITSFRVEVVPEPRSLLLIIGGAAFGLLWRRLQCR